MAELFVPHDESLMPLVMGSPYRVPDYAYPNWGLPPHIDESVADLTYQAEWTQGTAAQLALVSQATIRAGFGDFPELLRQKTAQVVEAVACADALQTPLKILDIGPGPGLSSLAIALALPNDLRRQATMILVEPSRASLDEAERLMARNGIRFISLNRTDSALPRYVEDESVDILTGTASVHHHARIPFRQYFRVLKPGGLAIFADWHQPLWEHPANVLRFLKAFEWSKREEGLRNWVETYPQSLEASLVVNDPLTRQAIEDITRFWIAYKEIADAANLGPNAIWPLEGHRPVERYLEGLQEAGFVLDSPLIRQLVDYSVIHANPHQVLSNSNLLQVCIGQKPA